MRDLWISMIFFLLFAAGLTAPFVAGLCYVWIDTFYPQRLADEMVGLLPIAMMAGVVAFVGYVLFDRRAPPRPSARLLLILFMALWVTATTQWAVAPGLAWEKWNWAFKSVLFAAFIPFLFRSRVQIEAFLLVFLFSAAGHIIPWAVKGMLGGAGYNRSLGLLGVNTIPLAESSTTAAFCLLAVPLLLVFREHSTLLPWPRWRKPVFGGLVAAMLAGAMATYARTALTGAAVLWTALLLRSRRRVVFCLVSAVAVAGLAAMASDAWTQRMATTENYQEEGSAAARIKVWEWTLGYTAEHPLGGGFQAYVADQIELIDSLGKREIRTGVAFHSIYFEMLGEQGWVGLIAYLSLFALSLLSCGRIMRRTRPVPELAWCRDTARALQLGIVSVMVCGLTIGIAFQPMVWYLFGLSIALEEHARRALATGAGLRPGMHGGRRAVARPARA